MASVDKGSFPTLFKKLWGHISAENLVAFEDQVCGHLIRSAVSLEKCSEEHNATPDDIGSPRRLLREAIVSAIASTPSPETLVALENSKKKRKRVQNSSGEVGFNNGSSG